MGLPVVREGTYDSVAQSVFEYANDGTFLTAYLEHIRKTNPIVLNLMLTWVQDLRGKEYLHTLFGLCVLYKLLESEADIIDFEAEVK
jgi:hypothetical protein